MDKVYDCFENFIDFFTIKEHSGVNGNKENMFRDKEIIEVFYYNESLQ